MRLPLTHPAVEIAAGGDRSIVHGSWRLADPKIALASLVPFCAGAALVWRDGHALDFGIAAAACAAILLAEVGKNAVHELYDRRSAGDADRRLTHRNLVVIAWIAFTLAAVFGTAVAIATTPGLLLLGAAAAVLSILTVMPPVHLADRGFGELVAFAVYGPGILLGTILLFGGTITIEEVAVSITLGILIASVFLADELPYERADRAAGKRTLVVLLDGDGATSLMGFLFVAAFAIPAVLAYGGVPFFAGSLAGAPVAAFAHWCFVRQPLGPPAAGQTAALLTYVVTGLGLAIAAIVV